MKNKLQKSTVYIFSYNVEPNGISGGETILIETFKRISSRFSSIKVFAWKPSYELYTKNGLTNVTYVVSKLPVLTNFYLSFLLRTLHGIYLGLSIMLDSTEKSFLYFSSDFWPDAIPVILLKLRYPNAIFISNFYLAAPNPFIGFNEGGKLRMPTINGIFYWVMQKPVYYFSKYFANLIFVTSEPDLDRFPKHKKEHKYFVVKGGVNIKKIEKYRKNHKPSIKKYDGVYVGRFHPQKGVLELLDIWTKVVSQKPNANLIMIGDGPSMASVKKKIARLNLHNSVKLTGYIFNSEERYKIFAQSRIVLHPAIYDSGGMAATEAMAFGLPGISFDLLSLKTYYPSGMLKVKLGNLKGFAKTIINLLEDKNLYKKVQLDAVKLVKKEWDWDIRANKIGDKILSIE